MSDLLSYALVTLNDTKDYLGVSVNTDDDLIKRLINSATKMIENYCDRRFLSTAYSNERYSGDGGHYLFLRNYPATSLTSIEYMTGDYNSPNWEAYDSEFYSIVTTDEKNGGVIYNDIPFYGGENNLRVNYTAGYTTIPEDIQQACLDLVSWFYKKRKTHGIKSESLGDRSVTYFDIKGSSPITDLGLDEMLDPYKTFKI